MPNVVAIRMESKFLKRIDNLGKEEALDRSTILRKLIKKGYKELIREKVAQMYMSGKITLSEAASHAGLTLWEMEHYLVDHGFRSEYSIEDLEKEIKSLEK